MRHHFPAGWWRTGLGAKLELLIKYGTLTLFTRIDIVRKKLRANNIFKKI
jgi:hypothetical protein